MKRIGEWKETVKVSVEERSQSHMNRRQGWQGFVSREAGSGDEKVSRQQASERQLLNVL